MLKLFMKLGATIILLMALAACGGGGGASPEPPAAVTVYGLTTSTGNVVYLAIDSPSAGKATVYWPQLSETVVGDYTVDAATSKYTYTNPETAETVEMYIKNGFVTGIAHGTNDELLMGVLADQTLTSLLYLYGIDQGAIQLLTLADGRVLPMYYLMNMEADGTWNLNAGTTVLNPPDPVVPSYDANNFAINSTYFYFEDATDTPTSYHYDKGDGYGTFSEISNGVYEAMMFMTPQPADNNVPSGIANGDVFYGYGYVKETGDYQLYEGTFTASDVQAQSITMTVAVVGVPQTNEAILIPVGANWPGFYYSTGAGQGAVLRFLGSNGLVYAFNDGSGMIQFGMFVK